MLESLFQSPVLQTADKRLLTAFTLLLKQNRIPYTVKLIDLNSRGGLNDVMTFTPHTEFKEMKTVYVSKNEEEKALYLLNLAKRKNTEE